MVKIPVDIDSEEVVMESYLNDIQSILRDITSAENDAEELISVKYSFLSSFLTHATKLFVSARKSRFQLDDISR